jgi:hypothetical protein
VVRAAACAGAGVALIVVGLYAMPASADAPSSNVGSVQDGLADVVDLAAASVTVPAADITGAGLEYGPGWIRMQVKTFGFTDPVKDANWQSDDTFAVWTLDTTGDGQADYLVEYGITPEKELYGDVMRPDSRPDDPALCGADSVTYSSSAAGGVYELRLDPTCLGRPASIAYTVGFVYDTGGGRGAGVVGTDIVPNRGFAPAVTAPLSAGPVPAAPAAAPQLVLMPTTAAPPVAPASPTSAAPLAPAAASTAARVAPTSTAPVPSTAPAPPLPAAGRSATPAGHGAHAPARRATTAATIFRPTSAPSAPPLTPATQPPAPRAVPELARTGPRRLLALSGVGLGVLLIGAGLLVMVSPRRSFIAV